MPRRRQTSQPEVDSAAATFKQETGVIDKRIILGGSIQIKGDLTGNEDVIIDGDLDGKIFLKDHTLTIGENGHIKAEIQAKEVIVAGELLGNITASDKVEIVATGSVRGDISAPRVILADGACLMGRINMGHKSTLRHDGTIPASPSIAEKGSDIGSVG